MTDEDTPPEGEQEYPDGYLILHRNKDTRFGIDGCYALGPYPPFIELAEYLRDQSPCDCTKTVLPCYFPNGVRMSAVVTVDPEGRHHMPALPLPGLDSNN